MTVAAEDLSAPAAPPTAPVPEEASPEVRAIVAAELRSIAARAESVGMGVIHTASLRARADQLEERS